MVKRRKKGKRKARRTAQPTQFARPLRCSAALAALLKPHCEMGTDARLAVGGALLLTRAAATRVLWRYARARGLQDPNDGRRLVLARDGLGGVLGVASATITELPALLAPHLASDGAAAGARATTAAAAAAPAPDEPLLVLSDGLRALVAAAGGGGAHGGGGSQHAPRAR